MTTGATLWAMLSVFGLGVVYFLVAIPAGMAMGLHPAVAAGCAWLGYTAIAAAMLALGAPVREWIARKFRISAHPDPSKFFWRVWQTGGLAGLAVIAPVTCGPYFAVLIALLLGERPARVIAVIAIGAIPWCVAFATLATMGIRLVK